MTDVSVQLPFMPARVEQVVPFAALVQRTGAARLWVGQARHVEQHQLFCYAAGLGLRVAAGFGVSLMPLRHPLDAAIALRSVASVTERPVVAGFGPGATVLQRSVLGTPYPSPLAAAREYVTLVRVLVRGEPVAVRGEYFCCGTSLPVTPTPPIEVGLGVLRPGMARLAGEVADVAVTLLTPAAYLADTVLPALADGSAAAGRPRPRLVAIVPVALRATGRDPGVLADSPHLRTAQYVAMLRLAGIDVAADGPAAAVQGRAFVYGEPDEVVAEVAGYAAAGVDEVVLSVSGVCAAHGVPAALRELEALLAVLGGGPVGPAPARVRVPAAVVQGGRCPS